MRPAPVRAKLPRAARAAPAVRVAPAVEIRVRLIPTRLLPRAAILNLFPDAKETPLEWKASQRAERGRRVPISCVAVVNHTVTSRPPSFKGKGRSGLLITDYWLLITDYCSSATTTLLTDPLTEP